MSFDDIIILVKESINTHGDIFQNDEIILDSNAVDHIADDIATALCGARDEPADVPVRHGHWEQKKWDKDAYSCSLCKHIFGIREIMFWDQNIDVFGFAKYCPFCGAKMDGKETE